MRNAADGKLIERTDWNALRAAAWNCLHALSDLTRWSVRSQDRNYDTDDAVQHLAAITKARDVFEQSLLQQLSVGDTAFDELAQACSHERSRPDFYFAATAHQTAVVLLATTIRRIELASGDALFRLGIRKSEDVVIEDLHSLAPAQLRDTLQLSEKISPLQLHFDRTQTMSSLSAWVDREWAAATASSQVLNRVELPYGYVPNVLPKVVEWAKDIGECRRLESKGRLSVDEKAFMRAVKQRFTDNPDQQAAAVEHWEQYLSKQSDSSAQ